MKKLILFLATISLLACQQESPKEVEKFEIKRGSNLGHWLSQSKKRGEERAQFITREDIRDAAEMGFDHMRLPIDEEQMWDEEGNRNEDAFQLMEDCIGWCLENELRIIIDLHILRSHHFIAKEKPLWTDPAEQEKFYDLWRDLSSVLNKYPNDFLAYELLNEAVADDPELWNNLIANAVAAIRELEPERTIVIGSNKWQQAGTFDELKVPENDPNIILSFHFYEPFLLTHYNAGWTPLKGYTGPVHYPGVILSQEEFDPLPGEMKTEATRSFVGREFDKQWILNEWTKPIQKAKKLGLPLYCGEFGIIKGPSEEDGFRWYQDMIDLFEENDIAYANWNFKSGSWGLKDEDGSKREQKIKIISGKK